MAAVDAADVLIGKFPLLWGHTTQAPLNMCSKKWTNVQEVWRLLPTSEMLLGLRSCVNLVGRRRQAHTTPTTVAISNTSMGFVLRQQPVGSTQNLVRKKAWNRCAVWPRILIPALQNLFFFMGFFQYWTQRFVPKRRAAGMAGWCSHITMPPGNL